MNNIKHLGKFNGLVFLLVVGFAVSPATGSTFEAADYAQESMKYTEIEFWYCTNSIPMRTVLTLPKSEWNVIKYELHQAMEESTPLEEHMAKQMRILYRHDIILSDGDINVIKSRFSLNP